MCQINSESISLPLEDGFVYEREALEALRSKSNPFSVPLICQSPFHSKLKFIASGKLREKRQISSESDVIDKAMEGAIGGDTKWLVELGEMYLNGEGGGRDEEKAYGFFERASEEEDEIGTAAK